MKHIQKLVLFILLISVQFSCSRLGNQIKIVYTNFGAEVGVAQNLVFRFSDKFLAKKFTNDILEKRNPIVFEPNIEGSFMWTSENELRFTPSKSLVPCANYTAKINPKAKKEFDLSKGVSSEVIKFHTPFLKLSDIKAIWGLNPETGGAQIKLNSKFNYEIAPKDLINNLAVKVNGQSANLSLSEQSNNKSIAIIIKDQKAQDKAYNIKFEVKKGLGTTESSYKTTEVFKEEIVLSSPYVLSIVEVSNNFENQRGVIDIKCSQELDIKTLANAYSLDPKVETKVTRTENGFQIEGDFEEQLAYNFTVNESVRGVLGAQLKEKYSSSLMFGKMPPSISFANKRAQYISNKGSQNIGLNIVNIKEVTLKVTKIFQNNILMYLNNNRSVYYDYDEDYENGVSQESYYDDYDNQYGKTVIEKTIQTESLPKNKKTALLNLDLSDEKRFKGVYLVNVRSNSGDYSNATKLVSVSDLGILTKQSKNDILVLVNSIYTSDPLKDVEVSLISTNNQNLYTLKTDNNGVAHFKDLETKIAGYEVAMVTATLSDDFNYMLLNENRVATAQFETDGIRESQSGWWAYVYPERNIYRPGETINFNTIIRNDKMENIKNMPIIMKLQGPNGNVISEKRLNTNAQGACEGNFSTQTSFMTGNYSIIVENANGEELNNVNINIEEFVPDKIKVTTKTDKMQYALGETIYLKGEAKTFYGPPSANRAFDCEFSLRSDDFKDKNFADYNFNIENKIRFEPVFQAGTTDANGQFTKEFKTQNEWKNSGLIKGTVFSTVFDENNRPVNRYNSFEIMTQDYFFGIKRHADWVGTEAPLTFNIVALNKNRKLCNVKNALVEVVMIEWQNVLENYYGNYRYNSKPVRKVVSSRVVDILGGKYDYTYIPRVSGSYEILVKLPNESKGYTSSSFYAYSYGATSSSNFEVNPEGEVIIECDKDKYSHKDDAKFLFKTPFNGRLLVSVERNKVIEYHVVETKDRSAALTIQLNAESVPNIYINATLIKKMASSDIPLTVAHGLKNIKVVKEKTELPISILAVENTRSNKKQIIKIKTVPNAEVTIAIVDEGILSINSSKAPNPYNYFYQKRALMVNSYDLYAKLFPEMTSTATGGDGSMMEKRVNPLAANRFKPVSIWSGILKANGSGEVQFEASIPKFYGAVRIMAVAYKDDGFGAAEKEMKIFDPIVMSMSLPRFLAPKDEITLTVNLTNTTPNIQTVKSSLFLEGPIVLQEKFEESITIKPGEEARINYNLLVKEEIGIAKVKVKAAIASETFMDETEIAVRPASGLYIESKEGMLNGNETIETNIGESFYGPTETKIIIDNSPLAALSKDFQYLVRYPHGCLEQTISAAFPQIYFPEFSKATGKKIFKNKALVSENNPNYNVNQAIQKLNNMVSYDGNMNYWSGYNDYSLYLNAYTLHFLIECEKNGYQVNQGMKSKLLSLCNAASSENLLDYEFIDNDNKKAKYISREKVYTLYVLALAGSPNISAMNFCKMSNARLHNSSQYILASTFALTGDLKTFKSLLPSSYQRENDYRYSWFGFSSPEKDKALVLNALLESKTNSPIVHAIAKELISNLRGQSYLSTIDLAYSIIALGKYGKQYFKEGGAAVVEIDGKTMGNFKGSLLSIDAKQANNIKIKGTGSGNFYYSVVTDGIGNGKNNEEKDNGLVARRTFYDRKGNAINPENITQNDLIIVKLSINRPFGSAINNIVLTDILPSGLEIENPRITVTNDLEWMKNQSYATNIDIRDDRINYFLNIGGNSTQYYYYMCRAVSKGKFQLGNVQADAMYDGSIHSYSGKGVLIVR